MDRLYAEHAQLRAEVAKRQDKGIVPATSSHLHSLDVASHTGSARPSTFTSRRTQFSVATSGTRTSAARTNMTRAISEPLSSMGMSPTIPEELDQAERKPAKKPSRPPVLIPGAPASKKVIPPTPDSHRLSDSRRHSPSFTGTQDPFYSSDDTTSTESDEVAAHHRGMPTISTPQYGYLPGVGYVPIAPSPPSLSHELEGVSAGQLVLYNPEHTPSEEQRSIAEQAAHSVHASSHEELEPVVPSRRYFRSNAAANLNPSTSSVSTVSSSAHRSYASHSSASSSLSSLGLLADPRPAAQPASRRGPHSTYSPEPSIASWGTVPSSRTSRSTSIRDLQLTGLPSNTTELDLSSGPSSSHNSSFTDLHLTRLPDMHSRNTSSHVVSRSDDGSDVLPVAPRALTWEADVIPPQPDEGFYSASTSRHHRDRSSSRTRDALDEVLTPRARHIPPETTSLGLSLSTSSSPSRRHVVRADDLHAVNQSLMRASSESRGTPHHRHLRIASMSDAEDNPRAGSRARGSHATRNDNVQIDVRPSAHRADGFRASSDYPATSTSRGTFLVPHTDRISGPVQLPSVVQRSESHSDYNRQQRHSSLAFPYLNTGVPENEIPHRHARVTSGTGLNNIDHGPSFSAPSNDTLASASSLGLSIAPPSGPGASAATTSSGEPSSIRAPRPVNGSHSSNLFAMWNRRSAR
ncbi:hypothetical protein BC835DRAFT_526649 [Cytidiella melzeri]|nr:hypothetical protein BC835DRAFT_526649 [Cytidiella melzeri]